MLIKTLRFLIFDLFSFPIAGPSTGDKDGSATATAIIAVGSIFAIVVIVALAVVGAMKYIESKRESNQNEVLSEADVVRYTDVSIDSILLIKILLPPLQILSTIL